MQDKDPAPGRPKFDDSAVRAALEGNAKWKHDKYEGGGRLAGRVGRVESGFKLCAPASSPLLCMPCCPLLSFGKCGALRGVAAPA